jgi:exodeoxyribonuclease VII large subunit
VSQLLGLLDDAVRSAGLVELSVTGTVTGLRPGPKFTNLELVDYEADGATVASVLTVGIFARHAREISATLARAGAELADGLQVTLWGRVDLNPRYGRLRLLAERVDPRTTVGAALLARDDLVDELERTGRLRAQAAHVVPDVVRRVGLVCSAGTAGRADVLEVLGASPLAIEVVEAQAAMSGPGAPAAVAHAIGALGGAGVELIVVARGGGAKSDLAAWESRPVAMAITGCRVPVWTALGHSTDHTLADRLAHRCLPTPSAAAAELVARAQAAQAAAEERAERLRHQAELAATRRRARRAVAVAVIVAILAVLLVLAQR